MTNQKNKNILSYNLSYLMKKYGKSRNDICRDLGIKYSTLSEWISGAKYPRIDKIELLAEYFSVQKSELIEDRFSLPKEAYSLPHMQKIPILGRISAGSPLYAEQHIEGYTFTDLNSGADYFALRVKGDSMTAARINDGDVLIVRRQDIVENGEIAVVIVDSEEATVKQYSRNKNLVILTPKSYNTEHQPQVYDVKKTRIRILGKVIRNQISYE